MKSILNSVWSKNLTIFVILLFANIDALAGCKPGHEGPCNDVGYISDDYVFVEEKPKTTASKTNTSTVTEEATSKIEITSSTNTINSDHIVDKKNDENQTSVPILVLYGVIAAILGGIGVKLFLFSKNK
ncbi:MAG: hypothetical protein M9962_06780 [Oligoflexia bacterium]|nr:hypothetical protein [Oligoflexia bacterium]